MRASLITILLIVCGLTASWDSPPARLRYPVALALTPDGRWLFTANQRSGSVSVVNTTGLKLIGEVDVGRKLSDLILTSDGRHLLAVDEEASELIVLARHEDRIKVRWRTPVPPGPVGVQTCSDGAKCIVASMWPRLVSIVALEAPSDKEGAPRVLKEYSLPLAPRRMLRLPGSDKLLVTDAFGGQIVIFDAALGKVGPLRALPAHNIRGLAVSPSGDRLLATHQVLHGYAETTRDNVHWGNVITNNLRLLPLRDVEDGADWLRQSQLHQLGDVGHGGADPAGVAVAKGGTVIVTLAGAGQVALGPDRLGQWVRVKVGQRPAAVVVDPAGERAYVANMFSDSVSVVDVATRTVKAEVSLGPQPQLSAAERGERLFHDARLAHDGWMSCHSCHTDGHTNGLLSDTLGDGTFGAPKRILSLLGIKNTAPYAWDGSIADLESQVRKSVLTTMHGPKPSEEQVLDLAAYLVSLPPPPPVAALHEEAARRGRQVFEKQGCAGCHPPPAYTSSKTYDVGLADETGRRHFNPPSLRGVAHGRSFFHDGRARTLEEVLVKQRHQLQEELTPAQLEDLLAFLAGL